VAPRVRVRDAARDGRARHARDARDARPDRFARRARGDPGHGEPFDDVGDALAFAYGRLASLETDDAKIARYAVKAIFGFSLLHRRRMREDDVAAFVARVPFFAT
jgi:hypothetical protein